MKALVGKRVKIRPIEKSDLEGDTSWARIKPETLRDLYLKNQNSSQLGLFVILDESKERIGRIEYLAYRPTERRTQCNVCLSEDYTGRGYGTDALSIFSTFLFETLKIDAIGLMVNMKNERAMRCYRKCGYKVLHEEEGKLVMVLERMTN